MSDNLVDPLERVLSTLNPDGTRRWIRPKAAMGKWWSRRRVVAWILMIMFSAIPWMTIGGRPVMLLDVVHREFTFFGTTFQPTEVLLLALLLIGVFFGIFLITAILGRGWCGWACPQTVYLEFLYRPIERWAEGNKSGNSKKKVALWRKVLKYAIFLVFSLHLSNTFLAYFAGPAEVWSWSWHMPGDHPAAFGVVLAVTALMMFDFVFFREQMCTLVCPYARLQSVLLDRDSLIVGYDEKRGEPRGKKSHVENVDSQGDCIDCGLCVAACPTGIDIRDGLQLECIACTQCIDACDTVMEKIERPKGLIRFASQNSLAGVMRKKFRPRLVVYPLLLLAIFGGLGFGLSHRASSEAMILRNQGSVPAQSGNEIVQPVSLRISNRSPESRTYTLEVQGPSVVKGNPFPITLEAYGMQKVNLPVFTPAESFIEGKAMLHITISDGEEFHAKLEKTLFGPNLVSSK
ncbi:MAG: cytochrome c oxidase accessory protein CcoG [Planctomycetota bacterium]